MTDTRRREVLEWLPAAIASAFIPGDAQAVRATKTIEKDTAMTAEAVHSPPPAEPGHAGFRMEWTFSSFIVGKGNAMAHAAALAFADGQLPSGAPLWISGGVGTGKTHLLHAIGHRILDNDPLGRICHVHSYDFMQEVIAAYGNRGLGALRRRYAPLDLLMVDDMHLLGLKGKQRTLTEMLGVFRSVVQMGGRAVFTMAEDDDFTGIEQAFPQVAIARIDGAAFDADFRERVLCAKAWEQGIALDKGVIRLMRQKSSGSSVRELDGLLNRLLAHSRFHEVPVTRELAARIIRSIWGAMG